MGNKNSGRWPRSAEKEALRTAKPADWAELLSETPVDPVKFINRLTHTKGRFARQPFNLRPWQEEVIRGLFTVKADGLRQYRTGLLMLPRKNGKTEMAAAIALYGLIADREEGAEVYSAAADRDQASLVFKVAAQMVRNDPFLAEACEIVHSQKRIVYRTLGAEYKALSAEAHTKHGFNASMVIYDELHAAPNRELYDVLNTSMGARTQPLMFTISTAGYDRHSILWEVYDHASKVRDGLVEDPSFYSALFEASKDADWMDEDVWHACNPALGDFRSLEEMREKAERAKAIPAQENAFRRLYLNQWTEQASRWLSMASWDACSVLEHMSREEFRASLRGRRCYVGMDLSSTKDLTALVAVFPDDEGFDVLAHFFVPKENMAERVRRDRVPYNQWQGEFLDATPGNVVDYEAVRHTLNDWAAEFDLREIAYDPWNATDLVTRLQDQDGFVCVPIRQGYSSLTSPTKSLETAVLSKTLRHDGHPVLRWNISNISVEADPAGNIKLSKKVSTERIDGGSALVNAIDRMERNHEAPVEDPVLVTA